MAQLEDLIRGTTAKGILPGSLVTIVDVQWHGTSAVEVTYKDPAGRPGNQLLYCDDEAQLKAGSGVSIAETSRLWRHIGPSTDIPQPH